MTVYKPSGRRHWVMDFVVRGRRVRRSTGRTTKAEAKRVEAAERQRVLDEMQLGELPETTLRAAVEHWQSAYANRLEDRDRIAGHIKIMFDGRDKGQTRGCRDWKWDADLPFHQLDTGRIRRFVNTRFREGCAAATIMSELYVVRSTVNKLKSEFRAPVSIEWPTARDDKRLRPNQKYRWLDAGEIKSLFVELDPRRDMPRIAPYGERPVAFQQDLQDNWDLATVLLDTGARPAEIMGLIWEQVDLQRRRILLHRPKVKNWSGLSMSTAVYDTLLRRRQASEPDYPWVFPNRYGPGHKGNGKGIKKAMDRAGLNAPHKVARFGGAAVPYTLRDTFASRLAQTGKYTLKDISVLLGHSTTRQTEKYAHLIPDAIAERVAGTLDDLNAELFGA